MNYVCLFVGWFVGLLVCWFVGLFLCCLIEECYMNNWIGAVVAIVIIV